MLIVVFNAIEAMLNRFQVACVTTQPIQVYIWDYFIITDRHLLAILGLQ